MQGAGAGRRRRRSPSSRSAASRSSRTSSSTWSRSSRATEPCCPTSSTTTASPDKERLQSPEDRARFDDTTKCILCAACTTSCPIFWGDEGYVGPAAIVNAHRFIFDSRDQGAPRAPEDPLGEDRRVPLPHHVQLHRRLPARHPGHEGDPGGEALDPVRPLLSRLPAFVRFPHGAQGDAHPRRRDRAGGGRRPPGWSWTPPTSASSGSSGPPAPARSTTYGELMPEETLDAIRVRPRGAQGPDHDARGHGVPQRERGAAPGARPVRGGPAGARAARRADPPPRRRPGRDPREHRGPVRRASSSSEARPRPRRCARSCTRWAATTSARTPASP